ncbi:MAG: nucleoside hydrolase [Nitrospira sp.]
MIMRIFWIAFTLALLPSPALADERTIWIDTDPACTMEFTHDVDDCWAIVTALRSNALNVVGLSTVFGNTSIERATESAHLLLHLMALHEPVLDLRLVSPGSGRPIQNQIEHPPAVNELAKVLATQRLTILALGPLTNIAMLLRHYPELIPRIETIVAVGGQRPGQVFRVGKTPLLHLHDLNVRKDPDAFDIVLRSGIPLHLIPFEAAREVAVTRSDLSVLRQRGGLDTWLASRSLPWLTMWENMFDTDGFSPFDALAVAYLLNPEQFTCQAMPAKIVRRHGLLVVRDTLEVSSSFNNGNMVHYCSAVPVSIRESPLSVLPSARAN